MAHGDGDAPETHCGAPLAQLGAYRGCTKCRELFAVDGGALRKLPRPMGITIQWRAPTQAREDTYRSAPIDGEHTVVLTRAWRARWLLPGVFGLFITVFLTGFAGLACGTELGLIGGADRPVTFSGIAVGLSVLAMAGLPGCLSLATFLNRTTISISPTHVERRAGPVPWGSPLRIERRAGERIIVEVVQQNDLRNLAARWPAPETHQVEFLTEAGDSAVLIEQIALAKSAEEIRRLLEALLAATDRTGH